MIELKSKAIRTIAQIEVPVVAPNASRVEIRPLAPSSDIAGYVMAASATAFVTLLGVSVIWLRKYFDTKLELSIARQKQEFDNSKEDRDRAQAKEEQDRKRSQDQTDLFLDTTLRTIKEEKDSYLEALNGVKNVLERMDANQVAVTCQMIELKNETNSNTARIVDLQNTVSNIQNNNQQWEGNERRLKV